MRNIFIFLAFIATLVAPAIGHAEDVVTDGPPLITVEAIDAAPDKEKELAIEWIVGYITRMAPPGRKTYVLEAQETKEEALKRYYSIAQDLVEVIYNPRTRVIFGGDYGRARTITVMLGIMLYESGFGKNVDYNLGKFARGDNGASWCMMQMNVGKGRAWKDAGGWNIKESRTWRYGDKKEDLVEGASGPEMIADRRKCFTEALRLIRISFRACRRVPFKEKLLVYACGRCDRTVEAAVHGSRLRITAAINLWNTTKVQWKQFKDEPVKALLAAELVQRAEEVENLRLAAEKKADEDEKTAKDKSKQEPEAEKDIPDTATGGQKTSSIDG